MYNSVDIIVPIYNAYEDLKKCVYSVKKYTDLTRHRLVLINDCSPDERISPYLAAQQENNVLVIENQQNLGFSGNVNKGMQLTKERDVLLLNSDTIVTEGWLDKIIACAYSAEEIGTVTPLSNSATLCSVPVICQDNLVPENVSIDEFADVIERCSYRAYPRITAAVGFCMYIKRAVIEAIGLFDAETFEKGYGEENDFCCRAEHMGYIHVMCDNTFVYHKGTVSFVSEQKRKLIEAHDRILQERYPVQMRKNHLYCMNNPDQYIRDNVIEFLKLRNGKKNLLYFVHQDFREDSVGNVGGTQFHVKDLVEGLKQEYNIFVLARTDNILRLSIYFEGERKTYDFSIGEAELVPRYRNGEQYKLLCSILSAFNIEAVHVHHTQGISFDIFYATKDLDIPLYLTLHDYYYICPNEKLNDIELNCLNRNEAECRRCICKKKGYVVTEAVLDKWRSECRRILGYCEKIFTPSNAAKAIYVKFYPELQEKIDVISHGYEYSVEKEKTRIEKIEETDQMLLKWEHIFDLPGKTNVVSGWCVLKNVENEKVRLYLGVQEKKKTERFFQMTKELRLDVADATGREENKFSGFRFDKYKGFLGDGRLKLRIVAEYEGKYYSNKKRITIQNDMQGIPENRMNIAFIGGLVPEKGSKLAYELIKAERRDFNWFIFGNIGDSELEQYEQENLYKIGSYDRNELPELMNQFHIDLVCILPTWPETYCYTLSEALLCRRSVLVTDIGAVGERVSENKCGWVVPVDESIESICRLLCDIKNNPQKYHAVYENVSNYHEKSIYEMCCEYRKQYSFRQSRKIEADMCAIEVAKRNY